MAFQTTSDLLSEIASNEDDLSGAGRKIELKDNLVVEFNNKASQVNPYLYVTGSRYIIHFYCLEVEACIYSDVVECLPVDCVLGSIPGWDR